jgi:hypothetical protein
MSLADLTSLKTAVANDWLHRADLTTAIGDFVALFESDFNSSVRVRQMETETSQVSTAGYLLHPTSWIGWKEIRGTNGSIPYHLEPVSEEIAVAMSAGDTAPAVKYKVKGSRTYLYPAVSGVTFPCTYYAGVSLASGSNWLLAAYPAAYLYGTLLQATAAISDDPRVSLWHQAYEKVLRQIVADSKRQEYSGQALRMRPDINVV